LAAIAETPVGGLGKAIVGVADTSELLALSPKEFVAETT
jgi:hypothetical protein